ncbi:lipase 3 precursor [Drepanopeziza brunnea f. sp. 'multigermtubi' MB_m1]|uniref:Carboxylic ester hydrolase n=1 Tax=Marssonina brunnea f. sp. multigermtubi (strain MB_m1) TaxID=1072389 RepID=K1WPC4_MARBU|nr:lipase 3 precursor [Drepanopeziza brunnea f. sp. 'multigermtubi' MB_m1]EKD14821.1 lipase 3 precursor [Drepanopeziza brunnea f. sp. 'multigermtubi' MB_m1]
MTLATLLLVALPLTLALSIFDPHPTVDITTPPARIIGARSRLGAESFRGIPFAKPPIGQLRLRPPQPLSALGETVDTENPRSCPQMFFGNDLYSSPFTSVVGAIAENPLFQKVTNTGEDCLTINVQRPKGTTASSNLPVLFWIWGGAFQFGSTAMYDAAILLKESERNNQQFIFVTANYRSGAFGFLPGKEIKADGASNLALLDQRLALEWVADNIAAFGGDPSKVTIWGLSSGAVSVMDQMLLYDGNNTYKGKPLFRGAIMNSGSLFPANPVDSPKAQAIYDHVVLRAGCSTAPSTLDCLRGLDYQTFHQAANSVPALLSYTSLALSYMPRPDGVVLTDSPEALVAAGKYAAVPTIIGNQEDEGTTFAFFQGNITNTAEIAAYLSEYYFQDANATQIDELLAAYPDDPAQGSPFNTGNKNNIQPQYKRLSAILGDLAFIFTRRSFLETHTSLFPDVPVWSYLMSHNAGFTPLGSFHAGDLITIFYDKLGFYTATNIRSYYFSFVKNLDPNADGGRMPWPKWSEGRNLMHFLLREGRLLVDDFRMEGYRWFRSNLGNIRM